MEQMDWIFGKRWIGFAQFNLTQEDEIYINFAIFRWSTIQ